MKGRVLLGGVLLIGALLPALASSADTAEQPFDVWEYRVNGNSVLEGTLIEKTLYPFLGPAQDLPRVEAARAALEAVYRERGFVTVSVSIPEQTVKKGYVTLDVVEQHVDRLRVTGARYSSQRGIAAAVPSLAPGSILNTQAVQRDLDVLSRRSQDARYDPRIKAGREVGTLDVELAVKDELPLHGNLELNNFASANTSDLRLNASVSYGNLFQRQHALILSSQVSPQDTNEVKVFSATYVARPEGSAKLFTITGVHTDSDVAAVGGTTVLGKGDFVFARGYFPLHEGDGYSQTFFAGADYKDSKDETTFSVDSGGGPSRIDVSEKSISYVNLVAGYNGSFSHLGGRTNVDLSANFGSRQLFNGANEFELKRFNGEPNYVHVNLDASRTQPLPWFGTHVLARLRSQWSPDQLIANEEFSQGGFSTVRGYLESEELADYGLGVSFELISANFASHFPTASVSEGYLFWDWGNGSINDPLPDEVAHFTLSSLGAGIRFATVWGLNAEADWAHVFHRGSTTDDGDDRVSFRVGYGF